MIGEAMSGLYMPLFKSCTSLRTLAQLHANLIVSGHSPSLLTSTKLIESYAKFGSIGSSYLILHTFPNPDSFMHGMLLKCCVWNGLFRQSIELYHQMLSRGDDINNVMFPSILRGCSGYGDKFVGQEVHGRIIKLGIDTDCVVQTSLLGFYAEIGSMDDACEVFDEMGERDVVSWSSIVLGLIRNGLVRRGLMKFREIFDERVQVDSVTMLSVAEACGEWGCLKLARSVHGSVVRMEFQITDSSLDNSLVTMYGKCGDLISAEKVFCRNTFIRNVASWTAMISAYNQSGLFSSALALFMEMLQTDVEPNSVTIASVLGSSAGLCFLREGKSIHGYALRRALNFDLLGPALMEFYADHGNLEGLQNVFSMVQHRSTITWNVLISVHGQRKMPNKALVFFIQMHMQGLAPDSFTLSSVLSACGCTGSSQLGFQVHGHIIKSGCTSEFVQNALIDMYSKCGYVNSAYEIFDEFEDKGVVTWNCMMTGFCQNGYSTEAISLFDQMYIDSQEMDEVTLLCAIQACSDVGHLEKGKWVHHKLIIYGVRKDTYIETALVDMYAKCGDLWMAQGVFDKILDRTVVSWSTIIAGYGRHGNITAAISLFNQMLESGAEPNDVAFMNILSACSHAGFVEEGKQYFNLMRKFGVEPNSEHTACMIDLLSRAGDLDAAYEIIKSETMGVAASVWGALLNGCRIHNRMDLLTNIEKRLSEIRTDDSGYYTLLSNVYAEGGNWDEFQKVRSKMKSIGLNKVPAYSSVETGTVAYRFNAGPQSEFQTTAQRVYTLTTELEYCNQEGQYQTVRFCAGHEKYGTKSVPLGECETSGTKPWAKRTLSKTFVSGNLRIGLLQQLYFESAGCNKEDFL